jgi:hypothetical protein
MTNFLPPGWMDQALRTMLGLPPDTRTPEQRAADLEQHRITSAAARAAIQAQHALVLTTATGLRRAVLELHGPIDRGEFANSADCRGCEFDGMEAEPPRFPCSTYELARDWPTAEMPMR